MCGRLLGTAVGKPHGLTLRLADGTTLTRVFCLEHYEERRTKLLEALAGGSVNGTRPKARL